MCSLFGRPCEERGLKDGVSRGLCGANQRDDRDINESSRRVHREPSPASATKMYGAPHPRRPRPPCPEPCPLSTDLGGDENQRGPKYTHKARTWRRVHFHFQEGEGGNDAPERPRDQREQLVQEPARIRLLLLLLLTAIRPLRLRTAGFRVREREAGARGSEWQERGVDADQAGGLALLGWGIPA